MPKRSLSYPRIRKHTDGRTFIDFNLNSKRYRLFSGNKIGSSLSPNSYPTKMRKAITIELAREVYEYLINNDYSFEKKVSTLELYDSLVANLNNQVFSNIVYMNYRVSCLRLYI